MEPGGRRSLDAEKLLLDPYAMAVTGMVGQPPSGTMLGVDANPYFDWNGDRRLNPCNETVSYEAHVKGMTAWHADIPRRLRGTYAGLAHPAVIE